MPTITVRPDIFTRTAEIHWRFHPYFANDCDKQLAGSNVEIFRRESNNYFIAGYAFLLVSRDIATLHAVTNPSTYCTIFCVVSLSSKKRSSFHYTFSYTLLLNSTALMYTEFIAWFYCWGLDNSLTEFGGTGNTFIIRHSSVRGHLHNALRFLSCAKFNSILCTYLGCNITMLEFPLRSALTPSNTFYIWYAYICVHLTKIGIWVSNALPGLDKFYI